MQFVIDISPSHNIVVVISCVFFLSCLVTIHWDSRCVCFPFPCLGLTNQRSVLARRWFENKWDPCTILVGRLNRPPIQPSVCWVEEREKRKKKSNFSQNQNPSVSFFFPFEMFLLVRVSIHVYVILTYWRSVWRIVVCTLYRQTRLALMTVTPRGYDYALCVLEDWRHMLDRSKSVRANSCHPNSQCSYIPCSTYIVDGGDYRRPITWLYWAVRISDETRSDFFNFSVEEGLESCVLSVLSVWLDCMGLLNRGARRIEAVSLAAVATVCSNVQCTQYVRGPSMFEDPVSKQNRKTTFIVLWLSSSPHWGIPLTMEYTVMVIRLLAISVKAPCRQRAPSWLVSCTPYVVGNTRLQIWYELRRKSSEY